MGLTWLFYANFNIGIITYQVINGFGGRYGFGWSKKNGPGVRLGPGGGHSLFGGDVYVRRKRGLFEEFPLNKSAFFPNFP